MPTRPQVAPRRQVLIDVQDEVEPSSAQPRVAGAPAAYTWRSRSASVVDVFEARGRVAQVFAAGATTSETVRRTIATVPTTTITAAAPWRQPPSVARPKGRTHDRARGDQPGDGPVHIPTMAKTMPASG